MPGKRPVIVMRSAAQVVELARILGHDDVHVWETARGWRSDCTCGWQGATLASQLEAVKKARHHLVAAVDTLEDAARENGLTVDQALSWLAVDQDELAIHVAERIESRERVAG
jgi:hypothetical protein